VGKAAVVAEAGAAAAVSESCGVQVSQGSQGYMNLAFSASESAFHREVAGGRECERYNRKVAGRVWQEGRRWVGGVTSRR